MMTVMLAETGLPGGIIPHDHDFCVCKSMNWTEFFNMGGYAFYVWTSYGLMAVILIANVMLPFWRRAEVTRKIRRLQAQAGKRS